VNTAFLGILAVVNCLGVGGGARVSNAAVVAKLLTLGALCAAGAVWLTTHAPGGSPEVTASASHWVQATLLLLFAYGGYEAALVPSGEARDPRRDVVFALWVSLIVVAALYSTLQLLVISTVSDAAHSTRPLADAAQVLLGRPGAVLVTCGALLSVYGYISANLLTQPRTLFALAEHGDFPAVLAVVHPRWRTPYVAIIVFALLVWVAAQLGSFSWNITLSAVARIFYYAAVCAAVPVLRRTQPQAGAYRIPGGLLLPACGMAICAVLLTGVDFSQSVVVLVTIAIALANWLAVRSRATPGSRPVRCAAVPDR
jgi:basic amino acid/polyamine antiporter, APA family